MTKRTKNIFISIGTVVFLALIVMVVIFVLDAPYRSRLPQNPVPKTLPGQVAEQLAAARSKAYRRTSADNIGKLGMIYYSAGSYQHAAECYQLAVKRNPGKWKWHYYLGYANFQQGEAAASVENFKQVIERAPTQYTAAYYLGEALQKLGQTREAEKTFAELAVLKSDDGEVNSARENYFPLQTYSMFQLGRIYLATGRRDSAEAILKKLLQDQVGFGPAYRLLGNIYKEKGNDSLAKNFIDRAGDLADYAPPSPALIDEISLLSRSGEYLFKQIDDAIRSGNDGWALKLCNQAIQYYPDDKNLVSNIFFIYQRQGNNKMALTYLNQHLKLYSNDTRELMDAMDFLYSNGLYGEALQYFNQAKKLLPNNSTLVMWLFERGKKQEAMAMMNELMKGHPKDEQILADLTRMLLDTGDDELAQQYFDNLKTIAPNGVQTLEVKGLMAEKKADLNAALVAYEAAYNAGAKDLVFMTELAKTYVRNQQWAQGILHFKLALASYPNAPGLQYELGRLLIACPDKNLRNVSEGAEYSERAFVNINSAYKTKLDAGKSAATAYVSLGDKKRAVFFINKTLTLAKQKNQADEYIKYFKNLVAKK